MKRALFCLCAFAACLSFAGDYSVELPAEGIDGRVAALEISGEQLRNLGGHPAWLRLYDANGNIVPWARRQATAKTINFTWQRTALTIDLVRKLDDGTLEISFHTASDAPLSEHAMLKFKTDVRDFGMYVHIYGKESGGAEHELKIKGSGYIFDSTENVDARALDVVFIPGKCRSFKVTLSSAKLERRKPERSVSVTKSDTEGEITNEKMTVVEQPFSIKSLEIWSQDASKEISMPQTQRLSVPFERVKTADGKSIYSIRPDVIPVSNMEFEFAEENYSRKITVKNLCKNSSERLWGTGVVSRVSIGDISQAKTDLLPQSEFKDGTLQVTIEDNDNPPLTLKNASLIIPLYRLYFVAKPEQFPLRLTALPNSDDPVYDVASILSIGGAALNVRIIHPGTFTGKAFSAEVNNSSNGIPRVYLFIAIGLAIVVMGAALAFTLKRNS